MKYVAQVFFAILINVSLLLALLLWFVYTSPNSPLPNSLNRFAPFMINDPVTVVTWRKMADVQRSEQTCLQTLTALNAVYEKRDDFEQSDQCGISQRILLTSLDGTAIGPVETQCHIAVRLALWERDYVEPMSKMRLGEPPAEILTQGSYNCRNVRTEDGDGGVASEHATANAVDVKGIKLESGREILLETGWTASPEEYSYLLDLRDGGCNLFRATLGPEYNSLHQDHFHFDAGRFRICR